MFEHVPILLLYYTFVIPVKVIKVMLRSTPRKVKIHTRLKIQKIKQMLKHAVCLLTSYKRMKVHIIF